MANYASVTLVGHLGRDVDLKYLADGTAVANFSLATSRKRKDGEVSTWWRCAMFGKRGEALAQYASKGDPLLVSGEPFMREYQGKEGDTRQSLEVAVSDFAFLKGKNDQSGDYAAPVQSKPKADQQAPAADFDDDIPF